MSTPALKKSSTHTHSVTLESRILRDAPSDAKPALYETAKPLKIVHISDTHGKNYAIPDGDILIHSGDFTNQGGYEEINHFVTYFVSLPHKYKILVPGNHEVGLDKVSIEELRSMLGHDPSAGRHLLVDESVTIKGLKFYGSPWTTCSMAWPARSYEKLEEVWSQIPEDTDILITHQPPYKIFDYAWHSDGTYHHWGCQSLLRHVLVRVNPSLHCFGHVHDEVGTKSSGYKGSPPTTFSNAAMDLKKACNVINMTIAASTTAETGAGAPAAPPAQVEAPAATTTSDESAVGHLRVSGTKYVLDLDAADSTQQTVIFWKALSKQPANQFWSLVPVTDVKYQIVSAANHERALFRDANGRVIAAPPDTPGIDPLFAVPLAKSPNSFALMGSEGSIHAGCNTIEGGRGLTVQAVSGLAVEPITFQFEALQ